MFKNEKTTQAVAYLLNLAGGDMEYLALMKLLYFADKKALIDGGLPMTFDQWYSMDHGPVLSNTLKLIRGQAPGSDYWDRYLETKGYTLHLKSDPGDGLLSEFEEEIIAEIYREHGHKDKWQLRDESHELPEWQDPSGSSSRITYREILRNEGFSKEDIALMEEEIRFDEFVTASRQGVET